MIDHTAILAKMKILSAVTLLITISWLLILHIVGLQQKDIQQFHAAPKQVL
jgi:hypothetical protein